MDSLIFFNSIAHFAVSQKSDRTLEVRTCVGM